MATTITTAFNTFKSNLEITGLQAQTVSTRQQDVRDAAAKDYFVDRDFLSGSYRRSTMIAPLKQADVDVFVVLNDVYFSQNGQASALEGVRGTLKKTYPSTPEISRNGQAVTISFTDFQVDVVPAFARTGGGFLIPSTEGGGKWIQTDPTRHVAISSELNAARAGMLVPLVKMVKQWNREISFPFHSFHLEALAWEIFKYWSISDYPSALKFYFEQGKGLVAGKNPDPAGSQYNPDVGSYINTQERINNATSAFQTALTRAGKAVDYAASGYTSLAIDEWRKIFGTARFPAYG